MCSTSCLLMYWLQHLPIPPPCKQSKKKYITKFFRLSFPSFPSNPKILCSSDSGGTSILLDFPANIRDPITHPRHYSTFLCIFIFCSNTVGKDSPSDSKIRFHSRGGKKEKTFRIDSSPGCPGYWDNDDDDAWPVWYLRR